VVTPASVVEGAGVHLRRSIGTRLDHLDPFLTQPPIEAAKEAQMYEQASALFRTNQPEAKTPQPRPRTFLLMIRKKAAAGALGAAP